MHKETLLTVLPFVPLLGAAAAFFVGRSFPKYAGIIASLAAGVAFAITLLLVDALRTEGPILSILGNWLQVGGFSLPWKLVFDPLAATLTCVVTGIGFLIHVYSIGYMAEDESKPRFFAYMNLFLFSMLMLVLGGNLLVLFVGWEGVGLCSYLLIGFWFKNLDYAAAGRKAFVMNRIGDFGVLAAALLLFTRTGTLEFEELRIALGDDTISAGFFTAVALLLFLGAAGKSAQLPLFTWLPDAMAGPTPVSALIHAATMVTAGIYMMARMHFVFAPAADAMTVIGVIAGTTALVAALIALAQNDIKKVLAYSTVSQLGLMFLAAAAGAHHIAMFHVVTHAFFKACLFLSAGSVIHGCHHEQDMRNMGGLARKMPVTFACYLVSVLAISGIWPFAGFFSKHLILDAVRVSDLTIAPLLYGVGTLVAVLTPIYMVRSLCMTFFGTYRGHSEPHEAPTVMTAPVILLGIGAVGAGLLLEHPILDSLQPYSSSPFQAHALSLEQILFGSLPGLGGAIVGIILFTRLLSLVDAVVKALPGFTRALRAKLYFDELYEMIVVRPLTMIASSLGAFFESGVFIGGMFGVGHLAEIGGEVARRTVGGQVAHYVGWMFGATVLLVLLLFIVW